MRTLSYLLLLAVFAFACSKKTAPVKTDPPANPAPVEQSAVPEPALPPAVTAGKTLFDGKCGRCHAFKQPELYTAPAWAPIMDRMALKARLSDDEKKQVLAYVQHYAKK